MKFPLGRTVMTRGVSGLIDKGKFPESFVQGCIDRHVDGDWGDMPPEDKELNDAGINGEDRLMSSYTSVSGVKVWVITEWDRSVTTVLLPDEY